MNIKFFINVQSNEITHVVSIKNENTRVYETSIESVSDYVDASVFTDYVERRNIKRAIKKQMEEKDNYSKKVFVLSVGNENCFIIIDTEKRIASAFVKEGKRRVWRFGRLEQYSINNKEFNKSAYKINFSLVSMPSDAKDSHNEETDREKIIAELRKELEKEIRAELESEIRTELTEHYNNKLTDFKKELTNNFKKSKEIQEPDIEKIRLENKVSELEKTVATVNIENDQIKSRLMDCAFENKYLKKRIEDLKLDSTVNTENIALKNDLKSTEDNIYLDYLEKY